MCICVAPRMGRVTRQSPEPWLFSWMQTNFNCQAFMYSTLSNEQAGELFTVRDMDINVFCNSDNLEYSTWERASLSFWRLLDTLINDQAYLEIQSRLYLARKECEHLSPKVHGWFCLTKQGICWRTLRKSESESFRAKQAGPPFTQGDTSALAQNRHPGQPLPSLFYYLTVLI